MLLRQQGVGGNFRYHLVLTLSFWKQIKLYYGEAK